MRFPSIIYKDSLEAVLSFTAKRTNPFLMLTDKFARGHESSYLRHYGTFLTSAIWPFPSLFRAHFRQKHDSYKNCNCYLRHSTWLFTGLYYEDALQDWKNPTLDLAISLLPADVQQDRLRRLTRANYLIHNHEQIDGPLQDYDPLNSYGLLDLYMTIRQKEEADDSYI